MKISTRDSLIYLAVGLGVAALLVVDFLYSDSHGHRMWLPSKFYFRLVYTVLLLEYSLGKYIDKAKGRTTQFILGILFANCAHLVLTFSFRSIINELHGFEFAAIAVLELFMLFKITEQIVHYGGARSREKRPL
jgi:tryptophan-rich sensory protein